MRVVNKSVGVIISVIALAVAVFMLISGISLAKSTRQQNKTYTGTVDAVVVDYEVHQEEMETTDSNDITTTQIVDFYFPVLSYTVDGQEYQVTYDTGSGDEEYERNSTVTINYLPDDPSQFFIAGDSTRSFVPYILYAVSFVSAVVAGKSFLDVLKSKA